MLSRERWPARIGLIGVLLLFGLPLLVGLRAWDLHNDESIYSYAVDRILETGEWLTPRSIPDDRPFLEKPPLKLWMAAGLIRLGVLPHDELGFRFLDGLFGALAFVYVYLLGRMLAGAVCGFVAVLALFGLESLVLVHGVRSNNMEAALLLCYCGGVWHFARWFEGGERGVLSKHTLAVSAFFVLGFMTKFVAALFLPMICAVALVWAPGGWGRVACRWRAWILPAVLVIASTLPWFVYQTLQGGGGFWEVIVGRHVYRRFTGIVDPRHLQPWSFYFTRTWTELVRSGSQWMAAGGLVMLGVAAWRGRPWVARLLCIWGWLPIALMSFGTSKLFHYAYPFLPPVALGVGYVAAGALGLIDRQRWEPRARWLQWSTPAENRHPLSARRLAGLGLLTGGTVALGLGAWTAIAGPVTWNIEGVERFTSSSVARPFLFGVVMLALCGNARLSLRALAVVGLSLILPVSSYLSILERTTSPRHPLRSLRDCLVAVRASGAQVGEGVYNTAPRMTYHSYYYYLRHVGTWTIDRRPDADELRRRLFDRGMQTPVVMSKADYERMVTFVPVRPSEHLPSWMTMAGSAGGAEVRPAWMASPVGVAPDRQVVIVLPGPFEACVPPAVAAGGMYVGLGLGRYLDTDR